MEKERKKNPPSKSMGERIRKERLLYKDKNHLAHFTQGDFAEALGVSRNTVITWERDGLTNNKNGVEKIANFFGVRADYLLYGSERTESEYFSRSMDDLQEFAVSNASDKDRGYIVRSITNMLIKYGFCDYAIASERKPYSMDVLLGDTIYTIKEPDLTIMPYLRWFFQRMIKDDNFYTKNYIIEDDDKSVSKDDKSVNKDDKSVNKDYAELVAKKTEKSKTPSIIIHTTNFIVESTTLFFEQTRKDYEAGIIDIDTVIDRISNPYKYGVKFDENTFLYFYELANDEEKYLLLTSCFRNYHDTACLDYRLNKAVFEGGAPYSEIVIKKVKEQMNGYVSTLRKKTGVQFQKLKGKGNIQIFCASFNSIDKADKEIMWFTDITKAKKRVLIMNEHGAARLYTATIQYDHIIFYDDETSLLLQYGGVAWPVDITGEICNNKTKYQ